jgi:threonine dehydrogenase-like Zn-dependent dehydrogenase
MREFIPLPERSERLIAAGEGRWRLEGQNLPHLDDHDLLFQLLVAGIRAEDHPQSGGGVQGVQVGEIAAVGDQVTRWNPSDRALLVPDGTQNQPSGIATYLFTGESPQARRGFRVFQLPDRMNAEDATLLPSAALAARLLKKAALPKGGRLLVVGLGLVGQILMLFARHQRVEQILGADPSPTLRAKGEWSGATGTVRLPDESIQESVLTMTRRRGVDAAVILSPNPALIADASRVLSERGTLILAAESPPGFSVSVAPAWIQRNEIRIQGVRGFGDPDLREAMRAIDQGTLNAENYVSKRTGWSDVEETRLDAAYWDHGTLVLVEGPEWGVDPHQE